LKPNAAFRKFLFPRVTRSYVGRVILVAVCAFLFFGYICLPVRVSGESMAPTYNDGGFIFCWRPRYMFRKPARHDVVAVRLAGARVMYLKRIVAMEGETVEFRAGALLVDGVELDEPYVQLPCNWNMPQVEVKQGFVYLIGDNRSVPMDVHIFGQTEVERIEGGPLW